MTWPQTYDPFHSLAISAAVAAIPVLVLLGSLAFFHVAAHRAALFGLASALAVAVFAYEMPWPLAARAAAFGAAFGLFPIGWIVLNAIFLYDITVGTGQFEVLKQSVATLAGDRRIQALLIAFSFGAFIEGAAGFGTPVAVSSAMLIGLGFRPLEAAGLSLIGNTAPVAFGSLGTPLIALNAVTGLPLQDLSAMVGRQLPFFSVIVPFWMVGVMSGRRGLREVWPACLVTGVTFAVTQLAVSNLHGPWLVDTVSSLVSMTSLVLLLRWWRPRTADAGQALSATTADGEPALTRNQTLRAWMPWAILSVVIFVWGVPAVKGRLDALSIVRVPAPGLDRTIIRMPPVVPAPEPERAVFTLNWLSAAGTGMLVAGLISGLLLGLGPSQLGRTYAHTLWRVRRSLLTIAGMLALGYTTRFSGSDTTLGLLFAGTGVLFPFFSALLGWLGVALTGSDTSSNVLFGNLQKVSAEQLGLSPILMAATNSSGGVMGKMIDAQSIVVATVATGEREGSTAGDILRYVFWHSLALASLVGVLTMLQAYVWTWMVP
jgi:lactate permease